MATEIEIERKYEVPVGFTLPDLTAVPGVATVTEPVEHLLDAVYYDTQDLRLVRRRTTLRRRTGGHDAGWHLKRPATADARRETRVPLAPVGDGVPAELLDQIGEALGGQSPEPVVRLRTRRLELALCGPDGGRLALVADDTVDTETFGTAGAPQRWRELEVELVDGDREFLDAVETALARAGARPAASASKLARALGDRLR